MTEGSVPQYKLILLKTVPGKCDSDDNLKIIGFTMPESFDSVFLENQVTKDIVVNAINAASSMEIDNKITRENLIDSNCMSITQSKVATDAAASIPEKEKTETPPPKEGTSGGAKKQSKRKRDYKNRNRRSQKK